MRLRQPNLKTPFLEEAREIDVEPLLGERKQRTGQIELGHDSLPSSPRQMFRLKNDDRMPSSCLTSRGRKKMAFSGKFALTSFLPSPRWGEGAEHQRCEAGEGEPTSRYFHRLIPLTRAFATTSPHTRVRWGEVKINHRSRCAFFVGAADFQILAPRLSSQYRSRSFGFFLSLPWKRKRKRNAGRR